MLKTLLDIAGITGSAVVTIGTPEPGARDKIRSCLPEIHHPEPPPRESQHSG